jgi:beta-xylosidase
MQYLMHAECTEPRFLPTHKPWTPFSMSTVYAIKTATNRRDIQSIVSATLSTVTTTPYRAAITHAQGMYRTAVTQADPKDGQMYRIFADMDDPHPDMPSPINKVTYDFANAKALMK